jgi:Ca2+-binding EF-hand superfamily protein
MLRTVFVLTSVCLMCAGAPDRAGAQNRAARMRFEAMDTNHDGAISRKEWQGSDRSFRVHDWNRDGELSGDEVRIGAQRNARWEDADHAPGRAERYVSWTQAGFNNLDHNRDRRITQNEWHYDVETFRRVDRNRDGALDQAEFVGTEFDDDRGDNFDDLDMNNNGRVERNEWHAALDEFSRLDTNRDGALSRFEVAGGQETTEDTWDQFAGLDYDRNGTIARDEWHWSLGSFDKRDLNRDGVLSRREFDVTGGGSTMAPAVGSRTVRVNAQQRWTDAGVDVRAGDTLTINASGSIQMSDNAQDTASPAGSRTGRRAPDAPILNQSAGALIARIDDFGPVFVGDRRSMTAPASGRLYFSVNDDHLPDNSGEFVVTIGVQGRTGR